jgi:type IV secretory pathway VirB10-like protein
MYCTRFLPYFVLSSYSFVVNWHLQPATIRKKCQVQAKLQLMKFIRTALPRLLPYFIASLGLVVTTSAMAQYMWLDASGRKVFSDQQPPANIPAKRILQQPGKAAAALPVADSDEKSNTTAEGDVAKPAAKPKTATVPAQPNASKDKDLEAAKKKIDDEAATKKKTEQEAVDKAKADNCVRAKQAKATMDSGVRLSHTNAKGERGIMDDATRMVETKRLEGIIASDCKVN